MSIEEKILMNARDIATGFQQRSAHLEREYAKLQAEADEVKAKRDQTRAAPDRLLNFQVKLGGNYQCPACWITHKTKSTLSPVGSDTKEDFLRCDKCGHTVPI